MEKSGRIFAFAAEELMRRAEYGARIRALREERETSADDMDNDDDDTDDNDEVVVVVVVGEDMK
jgi:hypothetical protein